MKEQKTARASYAAQWILIAIAMGVLAAFVWILVPPLVNSDSAAVILLANELAHSGRWLSPDWFYVSDTFMLEGRAEVARIGVSLFGPSVEAARLTIATGAILALFAGYWLGRTLSARRTDAWIASLALLFGPTLIYQDLVFGLPTTFQLAMVLALLASAIIFCLRKGSGWNLVLACFLVLVLSFSVPKKALVYMLLPIAGGVASQIIRSRSGTAEEGANRRPWMLLASCLLAWVGGYLLHSHFARDLVVNTRYASLSLVPDPSHVLHNLETIGALLWRFAGGSGGVFQGLLAVVAIACWAFLAIAPIATRQPLRSLQGASGFAYCFAMGGTLAVFAYLLLYEEIRIYYGIYYALVTASPLFLLAARGVAVEEGALRARLARGALACLLVLGLGTTAMACVSFPRDYFGISKNQNSTSAERVQAIAWLEANGYRRGFADYWDANAMTLVSGGRIQAASLHMLPRRSRTSRHAWLSSEERTNFVPGREKWFITINARRRAQKPIPACLPADGMVTVASYRIYLYHQPMPGCLAPPVKPRRGS